MLTFASDIYMKRYYNILTNGLSMSGTIFLGDLFDGVTQIMYTKAHRYFSHVLWLTSRTTWTPEQYDSLKSRWDWIFPKKENQRIYLSGNHDIGWNIKDGGAELVETYRRYTFKKHQ